MKCLSFVVLLAAPAVVLGNLGSTCTQGSSVNCTTGLCYSSTCESISQACASGATAAGCIGTNTQYNKTVCNGDLEGTFWTDWNQNSITNLPGIQTVRSLSPREAAQLAAFTYRV